MGERFTISINRHAVSLSPQRGRAGVRGEKVRLASALERRTEVNRVMARFISHEKFRLLSGRFPCFF